MAPVESTIVAANCARACGCDRCLFTHQCGDITAKCKFRAHRALLLFFPSSPHLNTIAFLSNLRGSEARDYRLVQPGLFPP